MQPLKQVLYQIDESGSGRMSYHDFYVRPTCTNQIWHDMGHPTNVGFAIFPETCPMTQKRRQRHAARGHTYSHPHHFGMFCA